MTKKTDPPERLSDADRAWIREWALEHQPQEVRLLAEHEEACLDHFRAHGKRMKDWRLTVKNWVRNAKHFRRQQPVDPMARPRLAPFRPPVADEDRLELARRREQHRLSLVRK